jgi:hypothetical protein
MPVSRKGDRMRKTRRWLKPIGLGFCIAAALALVIVGLASCGSTTANKQNQTSSNGNKLPPGVTKADASQQSSAPTSAPAATQTQSTAPATIQAAASPSAAADLVGTRFTIVNATRPNTNKSAISSSAREVPGDYLELELTAFNTGANSLVDLSQYSFRLTSPGIAADTYTDYYGTNGTFGAYVDTNVISGTLLNYSDLSPATYKVKVGETVSKVFLFYDLNPLTDAPNAGVTKDNSQLIIYKASGTDYGTQVAIPLSGYSF